MKFTKTNEKILDYNIGIPKIMSAQGLEYEKWC